MSSCSLAYSENRLNWTMGTNNLMHITVYSCSSHNNSFSAFKFHFLQTALWLCMANHMGNCWSISVWVTSAVASIVMTITPHQTLSAPRALVNSHVTTCRQIWTRVQSFLTLPVHQGVTHQNLRHEATDAPVTNNQRSVMNDALMFKCIRGFRWGWVKTTSYTSFIVSVTKGH